MSHVEPPIDTSRSPSTRRVYISRFQCHGLFIALLLLSFCELSGCEGRNPTGEPSKPKQSSSDAGVKSPPTPVEVTEVIRGSITSTLRSVSILEPKERASIRSLISGMITRLHVEEGEHVKAGEHLAQLSRPGASSLIQQASSSYRKAKRDATRIQGLVAQGIAPREELNQAIFQRDQSALELRRLRAEAKNEKIVSPISGVVVHRPLYRGEAVSPGQLIYEVMDLSEVFAPLHLPDRWANKVRVGMKARLLDREGNPLHSEAEVSKVSPIIDSQSGTFKVWVSPTSSSRSASKSTRKRPVTPQDTLLKPGLFVTVEVNLDTHDQALLVPREAIMSREGVTRVATVRDGKAHIVTVKRGYEDARHSEIISPLSEGEVVITFGQQGLEEGTEVNVTSRSSDPEHPIDSLKR